MTEESLTLPPPPAPPLNQTKPRLNPHDIRNVDLVQRFLAATPLLQTNLYSPPPIGPPNFFFSEMLRSLVRSKAAENARNIQNPMRRPRKRLWTPPNRFDVENSHAKESSGEKPLELTTKHPAIPFASTFNPLAKLTTPSATAAVAAVGKDSDKTISTNDNSVVSMNAAETNAADTKLPSYSSSSDAITLNEPSAASLPPSDLITPPIPPIWYPPLYPPYGIDPLHFFIDLRVSGQLYDRKKENCSPASNENIVLANENSNNHNNSHHIGKVRHGSAFSVPPRRDKSPLALNLSSISTKSNAIDFVNNNNNCSDILDDKSRNTNYVLQNLPRIYTSLTTGNQNVSSDHDRHSDECESNKSSSDIDVKDHEQISNFSDDVVIVDQDIDGQHERKYFKRK